MRYKVYYKGDKCNIYNDDNSYILNMHKSSSHGDETDDIYANNFINNLNYLELSLDDDDLEVSFSSCNDNNLLTRVAEGKTKVRLQLLIHKVSACQRGGNHSHWHCLKLDTNYYEEEPGKPGVNWARTHGRNDTNKNTYIDLTAEQLRKGYARFINATCHAHGSANTTAASYNFRYMSVEMFCPALYRSHKDIYYYEREDGYRYVADNCVSAGKE